MSDDTSITENVEQPQPDKSEAPVSSHLRELRDRLIKSVIVVVALTFISFFFGNDVLNLLMYPLRKAAEMASSEEFLVEIQLYAITAMENMSVYFKVSLVSAVIVAMPFLVYQILAFVTPGLTGKEKKIIFTAIPFIVLMFLGGVAFAYYVALPPALSFLYTFNQDIATVHPTISDYVSLVSRMLLVVGIVFETPIFVMVLAKFHIVSPEWLASKRRLWIVVAFILSALITPTFDPVNQTIIALPLILLLEVGILLARLVYKKNDKKNELTTT